MYPISKQINLALLHTKSISFLRNVLKTIALQIDNQMTRNVLFQHLTKILLIISHFQNKNPFATSILTCEKKTNLIQYTIKICFIIDFFGVLFLVQVSYQGVKKMYDQCLLCFVPLLFIFLFYFS